MPLNTTQSDEPGGICEKMQDLIMTLTDCSIQMRDALIHRRSEEIWQLLADKQRRVAELQQYVQLWHQMYGEIEIDPGTELGENRQKIREGLVELKRVEHSNATLSKSYLSAIRKALEHAGTGKPTKKTNYTKRGRYGKNRKAFLLNQFG